MPSLNRNDKVTCEIFGTTTTQINLARHMTRCSVGLLCCSKGPDFCLKSHNELNYHIAKNKAPQDLSLPSIVNFFIKNFQDFTFYLNKKNTQHCFPIKTTNVGPADIIDHVNDMNLKEELPSCQLFLVDSELEVVRHKVFNYAIDNLNAKIVDKKLILSSAT